MKHFSQFLVLILIVVSAGCSPNVKEGIVGKWASADGPSYTLEFGNDGSLKLSQNGQELQVLGKPVLTKYRLTDKNIVEAGDDSNPSQFKFAVQLSGKELVVTGEGDNSIAVVAGGKLEEFPPQKSAQQKFNRQ